MKDVNQIISEELEKLLENKRAIRQIINTDAAYEILGNACADCSTWCEGGCAILAYALNIAYGYPVFVIYNSTDKQVEHFGVKTPNNTYIDCDGEQRDWLRNFRRKDFYMHPEKKLQILPYTNDLNISDIVIDMNASKQLAGLIKPDLNEEEFKRNVGEILNEDNKYHFTKEDLDYCWQHYKSYLIDILNGEYDLDTAREDLQSLIGSKYDGRTTNIINEEIYHYYYPQHRGELTMDKVIKRIKGTASLSTKSNLFNIITHRAYQELKKFSSPEEIMENIYWHGTGGYVSKGLQAGFNIVKKGNEGGGGYGEQYHSISLSKSKNMASNFSAMSRYGMVYPVLLRKGATLEEMPHISDANEIEDILVDLWLRKIDAVKIGDWSNKEYGEEELVVLNPKAILKFQGEGYQVYGKKKFTNPDISTYQAIYNTVQNNPIPNSKDGEIKVQYPEQGLNEENNEFLGVKGEYFDNLLDVGTKKAVGYLPLRTIQNYDNENSIHDLIDWAFSNGNDAKIFKTGNVASGALYVWNDKMLSEILNKYKDVLTQARVPITPDEYIYHIQHYLVPEQKYPEAYKVVGKTFNDERFADLNEEVLNEKTYKVYHGTNEKFGNFDFKRAIQGIVWFTDSIDSIKAGEHGGMGNKFIMTRYITLNNPAGWDEYEKYGLGQLKDRGYDGVILPHGTEYNDYIVFSPKSISAKQSNINEVLESDNKVPSTIYHGGDCNNLKSLYKNFTILSPEEKMRFPSTGGGNFGLSATIDKNIAKKYSSVMGCKSVLSIRVNPRAKFIFVDTEGKGIDHLYTYENMEELVHHKYDAIMETDDGAEKEIRILRPDNFKVIGVE